jgi:hypothetical protein
VNPAGGDAPDGPRRQQQHARTTLERDLRRASGRSRGFTQRQGGGGGFITASRHVISQVYAHVLMSSFYYTDGVLLY